ncbi:MAG: LysE family transporter [Hydrogenophaga sp.]|nr:LysE family transporter [Hydrogenophaga sp.]
MFGIADYGAFVVAIIVFLAIPGPGNLALITSTGKGGIPGGLAATLGVIAGDQVLMWMAVAGVAALLAAYPAAFAFFQQALTITLLNPKAIVFYMAFFPLFVDPQKHQGLVTFGAMAATIAVLTFVYGLAVVLLTHFLAERMRASPRITQLLNKVAGVFLIGFGIKLAISK